MSERIAVLAQYDAIEDGYRVVVRQGNAYAAPLTFVERVPGSVVEPTVGPGDGGVSGTEFLRAALNCAWEMGLRPDGYNDAREGIAATKAHLADMRAIAFHKLGVTP